MGLKLPRVPAAPRPQVALPSDALPALSPRLHTGGWSPRARPCSLLSGAPRQTQDGSFHHSLVAPQGRAPQVQVKVERSVERTMTLRRKAHREGLTSKAGTAGHWPLGPLLTGQAQGGWGESGPSRPAAPTGQGGHSGDWGLALQPGQEQLSWLDPHVDRAASSPWWVTPTHPRPCSHGSLTQKVWGGAGQDPSCPAPRQRWGACPRGNHEPAATKASSPHPSTQQPRPEIQPRARCPSCMGVQHSVLRVACGVCRDGLWTTSAQTSPPSKQRLCFPWPCREEGVKAKALRGLGHGSGHICGHHTCHVS